MIVGYVLDHALGAGFAALVLRYSQAKKHQKSLYRSRRLLDRFFDCAAFLCFSIQVAAIVVLIKEEAGISTANMGDGSVRITEAVSLLTLLPLLYAVVLLSVPEDSTASAVRENSVSEKGTVATTTATEEQSRRFGILILCWLMAFFPFYCKMNNAFAPSKISDSPGSAISNAQFELIQNVCLDDVSRITPAEDRLMSALAILSYIPTSVLILGTIIFKGLEKHHAHTRLYLKLASWVELLQEREWSWVMPSLLTFIPLLAGGLIWTVMRVKQFQSQLSHDVGADDSDGEWTFGQVVAVTVFAPVLLDGCLVLKKLLETRWERRYTEVSEQCVHEEVKSDA